MGIPWVITTNVFLPLQLLSTLVKSQQNGFIILKIAHTEERDPNDKAKGLPAIPFLGQIIVNTAIYL